MYESQIVAPQKQSSQIDNLLGLKSYFFHRTNAVDLNWVDSDDTV